MGKFLTLGCKVKPRGVPKIWPISETGRANILKVQVTVNCTTLQNIKDTDSKMLLFDCCRLWEKSI